MIIMVNRNQRKKSHIRNNPKGKLSKHKFCTEFTEIRWSYLWLMPTTAIIIKCNTMTSFSELQITIKRILNRWYYSVPCITESNISQLLQFRKQWLCSMYTFRFLTNKHYFKVASSPYKTLFYNIVRVPASGYRGSV